MIPALAEAGLDGIEVYHPSHNQKQIDELLLIAQPYGLLITGGTDYHGAYGHRDIQIGDYGIDSKHLESILPLSEVKV